MWKDDFVNLILPSAGRDGSEGRKKAKVSLYINVCVCVCKYTYVCACVHISWHVVQELVKTQSSWKEKTGFPLIFSIDMS